ncbi:MAG: hypothetical protein JSR82_14005 [Verrucomicrobia bacterium]|nr:hypothetical protein [Verrucomicrobiota bacterium]
MNFQLTLLAVLACLAGPLPAQSGSSILSYSGSLTAADPTFNRAASVSSLSDLGSAVAYESLTFQTGFAGEYQILADYRGAGGLPDGFLFLYSAFDAAQPLTGLLAGDDDYSIGGASEFLGSFLADQSSFGPAVSGGRLLLAANTTYTVVVSGWGNGDLGSFNVNVAAVPEPGTVAAGVAAVALGATHWLRRRRVSA